MKYLMVLEQENIPQCRRTEGIKTSVNDEPLPMVWATTQLVLLKPCIV